MFLKEKQDRSIKGRGVADGRKQRGKIEPKDVTSPTVSTDAIMLTATIDALEVQDMAVLDKPGAYLSADMDDEVHVVFRGTLAEMMLWPIQHYTGHFCHVRQESRSYTSGYRKHYMAVLKAHCCSKII